jgi:PKD repeat protein
MSPLVDNTGLGVGDEVWLEANNLDLRAGSEDVNSIWALEDRGVTVHYDPVAFFPDPALEAAVSSALGIPPEAMSRAALGSLPGLVANTCGISDLTGIEYCVNLGSLDLGGNQITDISPLSGLTQLSLLSLCGNQIDDISALVHNTGLGMGDGVLLEDNNLELWPGSEDMLNIEALKNRGVTVFHDMVIGAQCPVDLSVTDPDGLVIDKNSSEIPGATYIEQDTNGDGELDDYVIIPYPKLGDYQVNVIPEPDASPTDTFSLMIMAGGVTTVMAEEEQVIDIPPEPYTAESTDDGTVQASPVADAEGPYVVQKGFPAAFDGSGSYDPDGTIVSYEWDFDSDGIWDANSTTPTVTHIYVGTGLYTVTLKATDDDGGTGQSVHQYVAVYDPDGGFVTGGGWINSPDEAYVPDPSLTGKATFGFVSKYTTGADTPTGNTEFQFKVADLNFHSGDYDWLVIAGAKAMYKGTGTINGEGEYRFMLTAIDGELTPNTDADMFRIRIWVEDEATGEETVVYDNHSDGEDGTQAIGGGSIVIHGEGSQSNDSDGGSGTASLVQREDGDFLSTIPALDLLILNLCIVAGFITLRLVERRRKLSD